MEKILFTLSIFLLSFNVSAIELNSFSSSPILSSDELLLTLKENFDNPEVHKLDESHRINSFVSTIINDDGMIVYYHYVTLQKLITDKSTNKQIWVDFTRENKYGFVYTKNRLIEEVVIAVRDKVNKFKIEN